MAATVFSRALDAMVMAKGAKEFRLAYLRGLEALDTKEERKALTREASRIVSLRSLPRECMWTKDSQQVLEAEQAEQRAEKQKQQDAKRFHILCGTAVKAYPIAYTGTDDDWE